MNDNEEQKELTNPVETQGEETFDVTTLAESDAPQETTGNDRVVQLEKELQDMRSHQGRVRKANEELKAAREENERLKAELEKYKSRTPKDYLDDDEREIIDDAQLNALDKVIKGRMGEANAATKAENDRLHEELRAVSKVRFNAEVERLAPGLASAISANKDAWLKWSGAKRRAASVAAAFKEFDAETVASFFQEFAQANGISTETNALSARSPSAPKGGNRPVVKDGDQTVYTVAEYSAALRKAQSDRASGKISNDDYKAIIKKFDKAIEEGRIVKG